MTRCIHCGSEISGEAVCDNCQPPLPLLRVCIACHEELDHGVIPKGSIHFVGGRAHPSNRDDTDAFKKANDQ